MTGSEKNEIYNKQLDSDSIKSGKLLYSNIKYEIPDFVEVTLKSHIKLLYLKTFL